MSSTPGLAERTLRACLADLPSVLLTVTGDCMEPALRDGDRVRLVCARRRRPRLGDVVLRAHPEGLRLHRLVWAFGGSWRTKADGRPCCDPRLERGDVLATVVAVQGRPWPARGRARAALSLSRAVWFRLRNREAA